MTDTGNTSVTVQLLCLPYKHCYFLKLLAQPPVKTSCNIFGSNFVKVVVLLLLHHSVFFWEKSNLGCLKTRVH